jgi:hypothetical protein
MDNQWKYQIDHSRRTWHCGIGGVRFDKWKERMKHIGDHWDDGLNLETWNHNTPPDGGPIATLQPQHDEESSKLAIASALYRY